MSLCNHVDAGKRLSIKPGWCWFPEGLQVLIRANLDWIKRDRHAKGPILIGLLVNGEEQYIEADEIGYIDNVKVVSVDMKDKRRVWLETNSGVLCKVCN